MPLCLLQTYKQVPVSVCLNKTAPVWSVMRPARSHPGLKDAALTYRVLQPAAEICIVSPTQATLIAVSNGRSRL
jgi:hypothetical protein